MRSCEEIEILINLYLDDMLTSEEQQVLTKHLENCSVCRARLEELCVMKTALSNLEEPVPAELHQRIMTYVDTQTSKHKVMPFRRKNWYHALAGVAACVVLVFVTARFAPNLELSVSKNAASGSTMPSAPSTSASMAQADAAMPESTQDFYIPGNEIVTAPQKPAVIPEFSADGTQEADASPNVITGQMSEDLPPLRKDMVDENNEYRVTTIRKWLKVSGPRESLPDWVDLNSIYEAELDGVSREYVEIAHWAEEYWVDQLTACGFLVEVIEDQEVVENGEHILLVFFWE